MNVEGAINSTVELSNPQDHKDSNILSPPRYLRDIFIVYTCIFSHIFLLICKIYLI